MAPDTCDDNFQTLDPDFEKLSDLIAAKPEPGGFVTERDIPGLLFEVAPEIFSVPFFTGEACARLLGIAEQRHAFKIREDDAYSAPEACLGKISKSLERNLSQILKQRVIPIVDLLWSIKPNTINRMFLTRYSMDTQQGLGVHHDYESDVTFSVNLNDTFDGGGIFFPRQKLCTKALPVGSAILFPGRVTHQHMALDITTGIRFSLTAWTSFVASPGMLRFDIYNHGRN